MTVIVAMNRTIFEDYRMARPIFALTSAAVMSLVGIDMLFAQSATADTSLSVALDPAYVANCASCHGATLGGGFGPPLKGAAFKDKWRGKEGALLALVTRTMPPGNLNGLPQPTYATIVGSVLAANGLDAGAVRRATTLPAAADAAPQAAAAEAAKPEGAGAGIASSIEARDARYDQALAVRQAAARAIRPVIGSELDNPPAGDWLGWRRSGDAAAFSPLKQIDRGNVGRLAVAWTMTLPRGTNGITPLARDGVIFVNSQGTVYAIDAATGDSIWKFQRPAEAPPMGPPVSQPRGLAITDDLLIVPTSDNHILALDVHDGRLVWDHHITGMQQSLRITAPPLIAHGKVIQGMSGCAGTGEPGGCFIVALDARTGAESWRFNTIARPGEPGGNSWNGASADKRYGGSVWSTGTYDPVNKIVYFGVGQTYHIATLMRPGKPGDASNAGLYTDSTVALDPDTGKLLWHYQHMSRDVWDMDWGFERTLAGDAAHRTVMTMGKLGILDILDARTGRYISSFDLGFQNLVTAIDPKTGRKTTDPRLEPEAGKSKFICPHSVGIRNWPGTAFDSARNLLLVPIGTSCMEFFWNKGEDWDITYGIRPVPGSDGQYGGLAAIDVTTRKIAWQARNRASAVSAALATAGGLAFVGYGDRWFRALDSSTGDTLWSVRLDDVPAAGPISFAAGADQFIAVTTGGGNPNDVARQPLAPEVDRSQQATTLWVFRLPASPPAAHGSPAR